jgi:hypothetical protein
VVEVGTADAVLAGDARRRAAELRAARHGVGSDVERAALTAVYAYEQALLAKHGKRVRATYTWRMIRKYGVLPTFEKLVGRARATSGFETLAAMGMSDLAYESVVLKYREAFDPAVVARANERIGAARRALRDDRREA